MKFNKCVSIFINHSLIIEDINIIYICQFDSMKYK